MKILDIALKDMIRSLRSKIGLVFMFGIPLLTTGMFYLMFGNIAQEEGFNLSRVEVVIANQDKGGPHLNLSGKNVPGNLKASTLGELVVNILQSEDLSDLIEARLVPDEAAARTAIDKQEAKVAVIIPPDFSHQFADTDGQAVLFFYRDPTLTIGPGIIKSVLNQFMDGLAGVNIAVDVATDQFEGVDYNRMSQVIQLYLKEFMKQDDDLAKSMLEESLPDQAPEKPSNPLLNIVGPIMAGMMIFYAFYTGMSGAESIVKEEEERTLPRLFSTPTTQAEILGGKFLAIFLTVLVQMVILIIAGRLIFGIQWGDSRGIALVVIGSVCASATFGIFTNSFLKTTKQGGVIFGGILTLSGMLGMIRIFALNLPSASFLGDTVSLFVPQGWAVKGLLQVMGGEPLINVLLTTLALLAWSAVFFGVGVYRFNHRYV